jgi:hypothetical protein
MQVVVRSCVPVSSWSLGLNRENWKYVAHVHLESPPWVLTYAVYIACVAQLLVSSGSLISQLRKFVKRVRKRSSGVQFPDSLVGPVVMCDNVNSRSVRGVPRLKSAQFG